MSRHAKPLNWKKAEGFTSKADGQALDAALDLMIEAVKLIKGREFVSAVVREAVFRVYDLPTKEEDYQRAYMAAQRRES